MLNLKELSDILIENSKSINSFGYTMEDVENVEAIMKSFEADKNETTE